VTYFPVTSGAHPHDVAAAPDGTVWYTAQRQGALGILDPKTGKVDQLSLGKGAAPHGVIAGPDGAAWITESGLNAIARVEPKSRDVKLFPLPKGFEKANLNTATFDKNGTLWFTGQNGVYGKLDPASGKLDAWKAPKGAGPYGITTTPSGEVWYASLAGDHIARVDTATGAATVVDPPKPGVGPRRIWSDSKGHAVGELLVLRRDRPLRSGAECLEGVRAAQKQERLLFRLRRREGQGVGDRLRRQRDPALRSRDREVRHLPVEQARCAVSADARPCRRGVGRGVRHRPAGGGSLLRKT
jgi:hypothetical protein